VPLTWLVPGSFHIASGAKRDATAARSPRRNASTISSVMAAFGCFDMACPP
jgi:hypothetical protein